MKTKKAAGASHRRAREVPNDGRPSPGKRTSAASDRDPLGDGATTTVTTGPAQDVVELLQSEHRTVAALVDRPGSTRSGVRADVRRELERHVQLEEEVFYPAVGASKEGAAAVREARAQHRDILEALDGAPDRKALDALRAAVERHVEFAEKVVFAEARRALEKDALVKLAERLEQRNRELGKR